MPKKHKMSQEDMDAFLKAMKDVKPLLQKKIQLPSFSRKKPIKKTSFKKENIDFIDIEKISPPLAVSGEEYIAYKQDSISNKILRKLRKGQYNAEAVLDLHGLSIEQAKSAVTDFLADCLHEGIRVVLIIHGKGHASKMPILKNKLNDWLRTMSVILAFCSASPANGGAIYALLKRSTKEDIFE